MPDTIPACAAHGMKAWVVFGFRCGGCGWEWAAEAAANGADRADMHRHKLVADRVCAAMGPATVLRLKPELGL